LVEVITTSIATQDPRSRLSHSFKGIIFVRYLDHVQFNRASALAMAPQIRETIGWIVYECQEYIIVSWDRDSGPKTLQGGDPKASGLVLLKSDIIELERLENHVQPLQRSLECSLNSSSSLPESELALQTKERKTQGRKKGETSK
jgi:hypothetical protein